MTIMTTSADNPVIMYGHFLDDLFKDLTLIIIGIIVTDSKTRRVLVLPPVCILTMSLYIFNDS